MTPGPPPPPPLRKPHRFGGLQVRICGKPIQQGVVCGLPPKHSNPQHAAIAITDEGHIVALAQYKDEEVGMWQLTGG